MDYWVCYHLVENILTGLYEEPVNFKFHNGNIMVKNPSTECWDNQTSLVIQFIFSCMEERD